MTPSQRRRQGAKHRALPAAEHRLGATGKAAAWLRLYCCARRSFVDSVVDGTETVQAARGLRGRKRHGWRASLQGRIHGAPARPTRAAHPSVSALTRAPPLAIAYGSARASIAISRPAGSVPNASPCSPFQPAAHGRLAIGLRAPQQQRCLQQQRSALAEQSRLLIPPVPVPLPSAAMPLRRITVGHRRQLAAHAAIASGSRANARSTSRLDVAAAFPDRIQRCLPVQAGQHRLLHIARAAGIPALH